MKLLNRIIAVTILVSSLASCSTRRQTPLQPSAGNLIIFYDPEAGVESLFKAVKGYGSEIIYEYRSLNGIAVTVPQGQTAAEAIGYYMDVTGVLSVTEDTMQQLH